jgi:hypothetical protein
VPREECWTPTKEDIMDLYTADAAHSLHAQDAKRVIREVEYRRVAKERAALRTTAMPDANLTNGVGNLPDVLGSVDPALAGDRIDDDHEIPGPPIREEQDRGHVLVKDLERNAVLHLGLVADHS